MKPDFLIIPIGLLIQILFLFKNEWLRDKKNRKWIWTTSILLFAIGYILSSNFGKSIKTLPVLMVPLLAYLIFRIQFWTFIKIFNSEPVDTFHSNDIKLLSSGFFNFIFWVTGLIIPVWFSYAVLS